MTKTDKLNLVNMILKNISANQEFEPKGDKVFNPQVSITANNSLNDWLGQDNDILEVEYENYMKKKENSNEKSKKILEESDMEVEDNKWTKMKCKCWNETKIVKEEGWKEVKSKARKKINQVRKSILKEKKIS